MKLSWSSINSTVFTSKLKTINSFFFSLQLFDGMYIFCRKPNGPGVGMILFGQHMSIWNYSLIWYGHYATHWTDCNITCVFWIYPMVPVSQLCHHTHAHSQNHNTQYTHDTHIHTHEHTNTQTHRRTHTNTHTHQRQSRRRASATHTHTHTREHTYESKNYNFISHRKCIG